MWALNCNSPVASFKWNVLFCDPVWRFIFHHPLTSVRSQDKDWFGLDAYMKEWVPWKRQRGGPRNKQKVGVREEDEEDKKGCERMYHHGDSIKQKTTEEWLLSLMTRQKTNGGSFDKLKFVRWGLNTALRWAGHRVSPTSHPFTAGIGSSWPLRTKRIKQVEKTMDGLNIEDSGSHIF